METEGKERVGVKSRRRRRIAYSKIRYVSDLILELMRERDTEREREIDKQRERNSCELSIYIYDKNTDVVRVVDFFVWFKN